MSLMHSWIGNVLSIWLDGSHSKEALSSFSVFATDSTECRGSKRKIAYHALAGLRDLIHPNDSLSTTLSAPANANWTTSVVYVTGTGCRIIQFAELATQYLLQLFSLALVIVRHSPVVIELCHHHNPAEDSLLHGVPQYITENFRLPLHIMFVTPFVLITR